MRDDPPEKERKQRAQKLRVKWLRKKHESHPELASFSTQQRIDYFLKRILPQRYGLIFSWVMYLCTILIFFNILNGSMHNPIPIWYAR